MRRIAPLLLLTGCLLLAACTRTRIPPLPETFDTIVVTNGQPADLLYAEGVAAFIRANWDPLTPDEEGLVITIRPEGIRPEPDGSEIVVRLRVERIGEQESNATPALADPDYGVPDLAERELSDVSREQNDPDSLRAEALPPDITQGEGVLTVTTDLAKPGARRVLVRAAKALAAIGGAMSYR